mmetsp:Transcript_5446/g.7975  ORF Transcript_5446/g.7975 Transcript_5446/m.7975 type:complete len:100 (-) Transcript_5446:39-338(-)
MFILLFVFHSPWRVNRRTELVARAKMVTTATNKVGTLLVAVLAVHYCCLLAPWDDRSTKLLKCEVILGAAPFHGRGDRGWRRQRHGLLKETSRKRTIKK